ncbi:hypothetical protein ABG79_01509 [Caloramator mitchellensis]|uniref:SHOCT domain-containing protein n=1 Tax=Caloramator mitchellensis TaxID=908809 RepID=A0A0R3K1D5_CALMK|nr:SHOCT domain-containing protein [Caloramator mitchellensis]KRQ86757.1 hypothetical protein ABG79_01509 [Caloramator mitchellensis]
MFGGFCRNFFGYGLGGSYPFLMFFMMFLFVLVITAAIYIFIKPHSQKSAAIDILNKKFANGDISEEEYLKKKEILLKK